MRLHLTKQVPNYIHVLRCRGGVSPSRMRYISIRICLTIGWTYHSWYSDYAKSWTTEKSWFDSREEQKILFSTPSRQLCGPPQLPIQWVLTYLLTYSMEQSPYSEANQLQLVKKFPAFHGTRRFITALTSVRHLSLS